MPFGRILTTLVLVDPPTSAGVTDGEVGVRTIHGNIEVVRSEGGIVFKSNITNNHNIFSTKSYPCIMMVKPHEEK